MRIYKENEKKLLANHKDVKYIGDLITMELKVYYIFSMKFIFEIFIKNYFSYWIERPKGNKCFATCSIKSFKNGLIFHIFVNKSFFEISLSFFYYYGSS